MKRQYKLLVRGLALPSDRGFTITSGKWLHPGNNLYTASHDNPWAVYEWFGEPDTDLIWFSEMDPSS